MERFKKGIIVPECMDRNLAERLVAELEKHPPLSPNIFPDRNYFINLLSSTDVPPSERFYEEVAKNQKHIPDSATNQNHFLSIRRVLRNSLARDYQLSKIKEFYETLISVLGIHDSDVWTRKLRSDDEIVRMMGQSRGQYSLLGKLETFDEFSRKVATRPLIIILDAQDLSKILAWEDAKTDYGKENSLGIRKISRRQYLKP